jgi:mycoredoxin-dependent peroxiredoxin
MALEAGTPAPDFTLNNSDGNPVSLSDFRGTPVYLNFFPAAFSGVCTPYFAKIASDNTPFEGAQIIGVSVDNKASLAAFKRELGADHVTFLADFHPKGEVARLYDVYLDQAGQSGRATFVIDAEGVIRDVDQVVPIETPDVDRLIASLSACKV